MTSTGLEQWFSHPGAPTREARREAGRLRGGDARLIRRWLAASAHYDDTVRSTQAAIAAARERVPAAMRPFTPATYGRALAAAPDDDWWRLNDVDRHTFAAARRRVEVAQSRLVRVEERAARAVAEASERQATATAALVEAIPAAAEALAPTGQHHLPGHHS